ncbi:hypothetical protein [Salarchaeum sp. JOR-1]|uniref:DUF7855 family protein n=1 Tax=Salarchaeum sp. JOR-1 TaxID=2599399 RepID=UPI0011983B81|nr:hypothetical protein [Salarchaeum sp. JOR-1]QDX40343.1 hypothetical protein FQU85_05310 [Salarchaeum sp. JOR-1]
MLLVVTYSRSSRQTLRTMCGTYDETIVRRFGRAALFAETELGAFLALRLRAKHGGDVQVERTSPWNEFRDAPERVRNAADAYESRTSASTPYAKFRAGTTHPATDAMRDANL